MAKKLSVKASALMAESKGKPVQVVAAYDPSILTAAEGVKELAKLSYQEHACSDCGTTMSVSTEVAQPLCVTCGSAHVKSSGARLVNAFKRDEDLVSVTCGQCGTPNIMDARVVKAAKHHVHCVSCGEDIRASDATDDPGMSDAATKPGATHKLSTKNAPNQTQLTLPPAPKKAQADFEDLEDDEVSIDDGDDLLGASMLGDTDLSYPPTPEDAFDPTFDIDGLPNDTEVHNELRVAVPSDLNLDVDADELGPDELGFGDALEEVPLEGDGVFADFTDGKSENKTDVGTEFRVEVDAEAEDDEDEKKEDADAGEFLMDTTDVADDAEQLAFVRAGNRLVAMKGHVSVASLTRKSAGTNADVMFTDTFAEAVTATAQRSGLREALNTFKFSPVRAGNIQKSALDRRVKAMKETAANEARQRKAEQAEVMALAAAGLARNYWKGQANPISAAFNDFLASQGVRRPQAITAKIMRDAGMQYAETLLQVTARLEGMSKAVRKEFADALNLTQDSGDEYDVPTVEEEVVSDGELGLEDEYTVDDLNDVIDPVVSASTLRQRLATPGRVTASKKVPALLQAQRGREAISASAMEVLTGGAGLGFDRF